MTLILLLSVGVFQVQAQLVKFSFGIEGGGYGTYINSTPQLYPPFGYGGYGGANFELRIGRVVGFYVEGIYSHIPVSLHLWMGSGVIFEVGFQQSINISSKYTEGYLEIDPDEGALKYYTSLTAGFKFNMGKVVYLNIRGTYGLSPSYVVNGTGFPEITASVGLGFRLYTYRKSVFK